MAKKKVNFTPAVLSKIEHWASSGLNKTDIASLLGYTSDHFFQLMKTEKAVDSSYKVGRARMKSMLLNVSLKRAQDDKRKDASMNAWRLIDRLDAENGSSDSSGDTSRDLSAVKAEILVDLK